MRHQWEEMGQAGRRPGKGIDSVGIISFALQRGGHDARGTAAILSAQRDEH